MWLLGTWKKSRSLKFMRQHLISQSRPSFDLLDETDTATLKMMSWDQQGMVDFQVMTKASNFGGIGHSSFAWNVALLGHKYAEKKDHLSGPQLLSDELSQIYRKPSHYAEYAKCLWP